MDTDSTPKRRVAVLYTHALFGQGIAHLLRADERLQVTCFRADLADTTEQLKRLHPHAIVMEGCQESPLLWSVIRDLPPAVFIGVHCEDNVMDIYRSRQVAGARPETLLEAVRYGRSLRKWEEVSPHEDSAEGPVPGV